MPAQYIGGGTSIAPVNGSSLEGSWRPQTTFPVDRSTHPLDVACNKEILHDLHQCCLQEENSIVARLPWHQLLIVTRFMATIELLIAYFR
jgi:hypothetical protein